MVKKEMLQKHGINLGLKKAYGPRSKTGAWKEGTHGTVSDGTDLDFKDQLILRFIIAREWRFNDIIKDIKSHLEWRQINRPMAILNE